MRLHRRDDCFFVNLARSLSKPPSSDLAARLQTKRWRCRRTRRFICRPRFGVFHGLGRMGKSSDCFVSKSNHLYLSTTGV